MNVSYITTEEDHKKMYDATAQISVRQINKFYTF